MDPALLLPNPFESLTPWMVVLVACAIGCFTDLRARKLPNLLTLPLWASGLIYGTITAGLPGLAGSFGAQCCSRCLSSSSSSAPAAGRAMRK